MKTINEVKAVNRDNGMNWFDPETMRFWKSKIHGGVRYREYFITSEDNFNRTMRLFTIRKFNDQADIETVGEFQSFKSLSEAKEELEKIVVRRIHVSSCPQMGNGCAHFTDEGMVK